MFSHIIKILGKYYFNIVLLYEFTRLILTVPLALLSTESEVSLHSHTHVCVHTRLFLKELLKIAIASDFNHAIIFDFYLR